MIRMTYLILLLFCTTGVRQTLAQDRNFHIYLCFGQSNMEGASPFTTEDTLGNERLKILQSIDCPELGRKRGKWYIAKPPLTRCNTGISPADYFGRELVEHLPDSVDVGLVVVAVGGCHIQLFDKDSAENYVTRAPQWMKNMLISYDNAPYSRLVELGQAAQKKGVIKGILLHQGESNSGDKDWPKRVKKVYENLLHDLGLKTSDVPLLAGELLATDQGGKCGNMNTIIQTLPNVIPTAHIVSSKNCTGVADGLHFDRTGYLKLGKNYARVMLDMLKLSKQKM